MLENSGETRYYLATAAATELFQTHDTLATHDIYTTDKLSGISLGDCKRRKCNWLHLQEENINTTTLHRIIIIYLPIISMDRYGIKFYDFSEEDKENSFFYCNDAHSNSETSSAE